MPLITITDSFGCSGNEIAHLVAEKLNYDLFDDKRFQKMLIESGLPDEIKYQFDHHAPSIWDRMLSREPQVYIEFMESVVYDVARIGEGVIVGHGSQILLRDFKCAFHVRLLSDLKSRTDYLVARQKMSLDAAKILITNYDDNQKANFHFAFQIDLDKPGLYDLVINTGKMNKKTIAGLIAEAVQSDDINSCSLDALSSMKKMSLERKIHAELLDNDIDVRTLNIEVQNEGNAEITGVVSSEKEKDQVAEIVKNTYGILQVNNMLSIIPYHL